MSLVLQRCEIIVGETQADFTHIRQRCQTQPNRYALLYPNDGSIELESLAAESAPVDHLILLDGTWKKAYKLWQLNPWLRLLPSWHFANPPTSFYQRKAGFPQSLSSLEACAYALELLEKQDSRPLLRLLNARQEKGF